MRGRRSILVLAALLVTLVPGSSRATHVSDRGGPESWFETADSTIVVSSALGGRGVEGVTRSGSGIGLIEVLYCAVRCEYHYVSYCYVPDGNCPTEVRWTATTPLVPGSYLVEIQAFDAEGRYGRGRHPIRVLVI